MGSTESKGSDLHSCLLGFYAPRMERGTESEHDQSNGLQRAMEYLAEL